MTPKEFRAEVAKRPRSVYLFVGQDAYQREICRKALIEAFLAEGEERDNGITRYHIDEMSLAAVLDDARSASLFASRRLIFAGSAETAVPKVVRKGDDEQQALLTEYLKDPPSETILVLESTRFGFDGDDKSRTERIQKYFSAIQGQVEFRPLDSRQAEALASRLAEKAGLRFTPEALRLLIEQLGADAARIAGEIEKLALFAGEGSVITPETIVALSPDARADNIFSLVNALAARDARAALECLDLLVRQGEYLPLALTFLSGQLRTALVAKQEQLRSRSQVMSHFSGLGIPMWPSRADQVLAAAMAFRPNQIRKVLEYLAEADLALRSARPDDRTVMEAFILKMAAA